MLIQHKAIRKLIQTHLDILHVRGCNICGCCVGVAHHPPNPTSGRPDLCACLGLCFGLPCEDVFLRFLVQLHTDMMCSLILPSTANSSLSTPKMNKSSCSDVIHPLSINASSSIATVDIKWIYSVVHDYTTRHSLWLCITSQSYLSPHNLNLRYAYKRRHRKEHNQYNGTDGSFLYYNQN